MKLAVCAHDVWGNLPEKLAWLAHHGFQGIQIWQRQLDAEGLTPPELLSLCGQHGIEVSAIGGGPNLVDPQRATETVALFQNYLDLSVALGPSIVTAESKEKPDRLSDERAWIHTVDTVRAICEHAENVGAVLALEPSGPCFIRDHHDWLRLAQHVQSPALQVNYDPANIVWAGHSAAEGAEALGPHIVHTHAKDMPRNWQSLAKQINVPAGEGVVDYPAYLGVLRSLGYEGYLTIEMHSGGEDRGGDVLQAANNLRRMLAQEGV